MKGNLAPRWRRRAISLFSNCGAGDIGFRKSGFNFQLMAELDPRRLEVCGLNHPNAHLVPGDLTRTWEDVVRHVGGTSLDLLSACPPCQGVSSARGNRGKGDDADAGMKDARNLLAVVIGEVAKSLTPKLIVIENVPAFLSRQVRDPATHRPTSAANLLIEMLSSKYESFPVLVDLREYGVPQSRKRTFITFVRKDMRFLSRLSRSGLIPFPRPTHGGDGENPITLGDVLRDLALPPLDAHSEQAASSTIANGLHCVPVWTDRRYEIVNAIPKGSGLSAWDNGTCPACRRQNIRTDVAVCPDCSTLLLRPSVTSSNGEFRLVRGFRTSSYRRLDPSAPASTITTASGHWGSHNTLHPWENRVLSPLECAYLQTFPSGFKWGNALQRWGHTNIREMIGEAVPPLFTEIHGRLLNKLLAGICPRNMMSVNDERHSQACDKLGCSS